MKKLLLLSLLLSSFSSFAQTYSRAKIYADYNGLVRLAELGLAIDHGTIKRETFIISDFSDTEISLAKENGFTVDILIPDVQAYYINQNKGNQSVEKNTTCNSNTSSTFDPVVPSNFNLGSMGGFYTYQEFIDEIDAMAAQFPTLITAKSPISTFTTHEGRPIYWMRMSDNATTDEAEPEVLYTSIHHAREPNSLSEVIFYMWYMLENYSSSEEIQYLINNTEMYFVPMINPDGYIYNETTSPSGGGMWRKNRRNNGGSYGVDLNRNYSYQWNTTGVSPNPSNDTYPGTSPFSEPETQAIKWFCENRDFVYAFNAHTYASDILFPIGATSAEFAEDHDYFQLFTEEMVKFNNYSNYKSSQLYPASGDSDDYMYKVDTIIKPKIFAMTPEVSDTPGGFWPAQSLITGICKDMVWSNMMLAHLSHRYLVVEDTDPNSVVAISGSFNHSATRIGIENGPVTVSITPISGISSVGTGTVHNLTLSQNTTGAITYTLNPSIAYGDEIKYVLNTEYVGWTKHDTIIKRFGALTSQVLDPATATTDWTGNFSLTTSTFVSPSSSFTDSPVGNYGSNTTRTYTYVPSIDLTNATEAAISYYAKWALETDYDYVQFEVSTNNGATWNGQCGNYTRIATSGDGVQPVGEPIYDGEQLTWVKEEISLSDYIGQTIKVRFILKSDGGVNEDGFYFDDFEILYNLDDASINELEANMIQLVPNPSSESTTVILKKQSANSTITLIDLNGKVVYTSNISNSSNSTIIPTENLKAGMYTVLVEGESFTGKTKLIVMH